MPVSRLLNMSTFSLEMPIKISGDNKPYRPIMIFNQISNCSLFSNVSARRASSQLPIAIPSIKQASTLVTAKTEAPNIRVRYLDQTSSKTSQHTPDKKIALESMKGWEGTEACFGILSFIHEVPGYFRSNALNDTRGLPKSDSTNL